MYTAKTFTLLVTLSLAHASTSTPTNAEDRQAEGASNALRLAVSLSDASTRMTAVGLSSLAESEGPDLRIDTTWTRAGKDALDRLEAREAELALLPLGEIGPDGLDSRPALRAVMKYWTADDAAGDGDGQWSEQLLIASTVLSSERVKSLLEIALQDHVVLQAARIDVTKLTPDQALTGLPIAAHDGVDEYLRRTADASRAPSVAKAAADVGARSPALSPKPGYTRAEILAARADALDENGSGRSFTLYFGTADASLDRSGLQAVAAACRYAAGLPRARFVISGHTDTVGTDAFNDGLSKRRASVVADAIRNDPRFREALSLVEFGEQRLAVATDDDVAEPRNRRVEITVIQE